MSDLQIVLIIIGGFIIAAVLVLNWWQERRFHQQVERNFSDLQSDALLDEPDIDTSKYEAEDDFSIGDDALKDTIPTGVHHDHAIDQSSQKAEDAQPDEQDIDTTYRELVSHQQAAAKEPQKVDSYTEADPTPAEIKPVKHDGIKAIFNEAFNNPSQADSKKNSEIAQPNQIELEEPALSLPAMLHAQMDLVAMLYLAAESTIGDLAKSINGIFDSYDKPVFVHVLDSNTQWVQLNDVSSKPEFANHKVSKVTCAIQLADRAGPVTRSVLNRFQLAVETLGLDIDAHVEWQSTGDAIAMANALDAFCIEVDKTMGFHLVHGDSGAFTGTKLRGLAEAQGLVLDADGTFKYYDEALGKQSPEAASSTQTPSFVMFNRDLNPFSPDMLRTSVVKAVTFQLDIPHVKHCTEAFNHMVQVAKQMEVGLNAVLVDDNNKTLGDIQIEKIRHQLKIIHATMLTRGIVPGSDSAHRLFS